MSTVRCPQSEVGRWGRFALRRGELLIQGSEPLAAQPMLCGRALDGVCSFTLRLNASKARFPMVAEVSYGGIAATSMDDVVVFHLLESWPQASGLSPFPLLCSLGSWQTSLGQEWLLNEIYNDLRSSGRDILMEMLRGVLKGGVARNWTTALLKRPIAEPQSLFLRCPYCSPESPPALAMQVRTRWLGL